MTSHFMNHGNRLSESFSRPGQWWLALLVAGCLGLRPAQATVPPPEQLLPADTLLMVTTPDCAKLQASLRQSPTGQLWNDPAMQSFRDKFIAQWKENFLQPLERELNLKLDSYALLPQGQVTLAITQNGWQGGADPAPGLLLLVDAKDQAGLLRTNLAALRQKWIEADKVVRTEKIRDFDFLILPLRTNDIPKTLRQFFPKSLEMHELGEEESRKAPARSELVVGQVDSLLIAGSSVPVVERVVQRLTGGGLPSLGEQAAYAANHLALFRDAPCYGWLNAKTLIDILTLKIAQKKENPQAPNPLDFIKPEKLLNASGLAGLKSVAFAAQTGSEGTAFQLFLGVPEASRQGLFKVLAGEAKETSVPPFVPADAVKFQRWRVDGQKAWLAFEKLLSDVWPQLLEGLDFIIKTANLAAQSADPGFDVRKALVGNLGDDLVSYEKVPRGASPQDLSSPPSLWVLRSPNAQQLGASLKYILVFVGAQAGAPAEREFLGRKIFSMPLMSLPIQVPLGPKPVPRTLHYAVNGDCVAFAYDAATLEEYLRSAETQGKTLRETPGLAEAAQKVLGPGTSLFGYENQVETMRLAFENWKKNPPASSAPSSLSSLNSMTSLTLPDRSFRELMDFSLLPPFEKVSKYFSFKVYSGSATVDGLTYKQFLPVPPPKPAAPAPLPPPVTSTNQVLPPPPPPPPPAPSTNLTPPPPPAAPGSNSVAPPKAPAK